MKTLTEQLLDKGLSEHVLNEKQLARLLGGSDARRYGLVNRAIKSGELNRLRRGLYILSDKYRKQNPHPFSIAQILMPGSYVSFETALAHHGWIPEAVYTTTSAIPGRKTKEFTHEKYGSLSFHPLAIQRGYFLELVERKQFNKQTMLIAKPVRALMDLVCLRKEKWQGLEWLTDGLRIDYEQLSRITNAEFRILKLVFKQKRVKGFLKRLAKELGND